MLAQKHKPKKKKKNSNNNNDETCSLNGCSFVMQYLEILCLNVVISVDIMLRFGITRINGPNIIFVVILFEMGGRV